MKTTAYVVYSLIVLLLGLAGFFYKATAPQRDVEALATQGIWLEEKISKGMLLANREASPEVIFIGASTTQAHTATDIFAEADIDIFNYGLPGWFMADYPYVVERAIAAGPRMIVINVPPWELEELGCPFAPYWADMRANMALRGIFSGCDLIHDMLLNKIPAVRYKDFLPKYNPLINEWFFDILSAWDNSREVAQAHRTQINYIRGAYSRFVMTLSSGDALLFTRNGLARKLETREVNISQIDPLVFGMLEHLVTRIREAGIQPIITIIPSHYERFWVLQDMEKLEALDVPVIRGEHFADDTDYWVDPTHFGYEGRAAWNRWLIPQIREIMNASN